MEAASAAVRAGLSPRRPPLTAVDDASAASVCGPVCSSGTESALICRVLWVVLVAREPLADQFAFPELPAAAFPLIFKRFRTGRRRRAKPGYDR